MKALSLCSPLGSVLLLFRLLSNKSLNSFINNNSVSSSSTFPKA
nr:MAG TPA: hypothetical protein [Bacteriophage sp.]